ncbi:FAD/NAD(P)-binding domain-containing protein [Aspergillus unguis]
MPDQAREDALKGYGEILPPNVAVGEATEAYKGVDDVAYAISRLPLGTPRPLKVICVGAGFSGLAFAREVEVGNLPNVRLTVYEKKRLGWGDLYSWAPCPDFRSYYATGQDIHTYIEAVADQHNLRKYVKVSHKVIGAKWIEERQKWQVTIVPTDGRELMVSNRVNKDGEAGEPFTEECDVLINAGGCFNDWKWPSIPGRETFKGQMIHSAAWPKTTELKGKTVALIGNGSTGVQILPNILDDVEKVYVYIRSRTWVTASFAQKFAGPNGANVFFTEEQKNRWAENPDEYLQYRKEVESELNSRFRLYLKDSDAQKEALAYSVSQMTEKLASKPEIGEKLIPEWAVGCRRTTPGNGYLEALCSPKVEIIWGEIDSFNETGLLAANGAQRDVDAIICATGFNMSFSPRFPIIGRNKVNLQEKWDDKPECYLSVTAADMPNFFIYLGPGSPLGHGSVVSSLERVTEYIAQFIRKLQTQNYSSVVPKPHIPHEYQKQALAWLEKTAWSSNCASTYKNGKPDGPLISLHPGSRLHYFELLKHPRWEDFDWSSLCDGGGLTFAWLGNGFIVEECKEKTEADLTWFLPPVEASKMVRVTF